MHSEFNIYDLTDFLLQANYEYKRKGEEIVFARCPYCEQDRQKHSDHFSFNSQTGQFFCVKCNTKGNLITFKRDQGFEPFKYQVYHKPDQLKVSVYKNQQDSYFQSYQEKRGIPVDVLKKYNVGMVIDNKMGACRTYNYIDIDTKEIVNVKYVNAKKQMRTETNAKKIYYGLQFVNFEKEYLHVVEGEDDCHALIAMGIDNVVSVPFGAGNYSEEMGQINKKFKTIFILFDNDMAGQEGAKKFSYKAGVWKCKNVLLPFKDSRDCLLNGLDIFDIEKLKGLSKQFDYAPEIKVRPALSIIERMEKYEKDARENPEGLKFGYELIDDVTGGLRGGDLLSIVANPGCFKTTKLMNLIKRSIDKTEEGIAIFFSLEMQAEAEFERELQIMFACEKPCNVRWSANKNDENWIGLKKIISESQYNRIWVVDETWLTIEDIKKTIELTEEVSNQKCILVGIDYLDFVSTDSTKEYDSVKSIMTGLKKKIAKELKVPVIALCQTNRSTQDAEDEVRTRSGKGGTAIEATSDFSIGLWRNGADVMGRFLKHRRFNAIKFGENPYFKLVMDRKILFINDLVICDKPEKERDF
jgi:5S rRNA maturation endonuclease (ribonuclease M5)